MGHPTLSRPGPRAIPVPLGPAGHPTVAVALLPGPDPSLFQLRPRENGGPACPRARSRQGQSPGQVQHGAPLPSAPSLSWPGPPPPHLSFSPKPKFGGGSLKQARDRGSGSMFCATLSLLVQRLLCPGRAVSVFLRFQHPPLGCSAARTTGKFSQEKLECTPFSSMSCPLLIWAAGWCGRWGVQAAPYPSSRCGC